MSTLNRFLRWCKKSVDKEVGKVIKRGHRYVFVKFADVLGTLTFMLLLTSVSHASCHGGKQ